MRVPSLQQLEVMIGEVVADPLYVGSAKTDIDDRDLRTLAERLEVFDREPKFRNGRSLSAFHRDTLAELMTVALMTVASKRIFPNEANQVFAKRLLESLASSNRCQFRPADLWPQIYSIAMGVSDHDENLIEFLIDFVKGWFIDELDRSSHSEQKPAGDVDQIRSFVTTGLTNVPEPRLYRLERISDQVAEVFSEHELRLATYQPIAHTHPIRHSQAAHDPIFIHGLDSARIAASDAVVAILDEPSTGVGIALAYAERARALLLMLVSGSAGRSPLLLGLGCRKSIYIVDFTTDVRGLVRRFLADNSLELEAHRNMRHSRTTIYERDIAKYRAALVNQGLAVVSKRLPAFLDITRAREILQSTDFFATQTVEENRILSRALRVDGSEKSGGGASIRRRSLSDEELAALEDYAVLQGLSGGAVIGMQRRALQALASHDARRLRLSNAVDWRPFDLAAGA